MSLGRGFDFARNKSWFVAQDTALACCIAVERFCRVPAQVGGKALPQGAHDVARYVLNLGLEAGAGVIPFQPESNEAIATHDLVQQVPRLVGVLLRQSPHLGNCP